MHNINIELQFTLTHHVLQYNHLCGMISRRISRIGRVRHVDVVLI